MENKSITKRDVDFAKWYTDVVMAANLASYSKVKGCIVMEPNGYAIWERMQSVLDKMFKETGHSNVCMPLLIPEELMKKEGELVNGFAPECAWVTEGGQKKLEERLCIRPTSETLFSDYYSTKVKSYRDLPLKYNQWCNILRWEKETRPFLRGREFLWQEGHTVHATSQEAKAETQYIMENVYKKFFYDYLAIPGITGIKTEKEKFSGAEYTLTIESLMYNGICLQSGTSHYFGQKFSKAYDIKFVNEKNEYEYAYQTSWGVSTRMIAALIMVHSDDYGLVLPPKIAPKQVAIIPITTSDRVKDLANKCFNILNENGITTYIYNTDKSAGFKFAESEVNGIPLRIEIGDRDLDKNIVTLARRDDRSKITISIDDDILNEVNKLLDEIQNNLYKKALNRRNEMTYSPNNLEEMKKIIETKPGFIKAYWCGNEECENKIKEVNGIKSRCILPNEKSDGKKCVCCGKDAKHLVIWGIQY